MKIMTTFIDTSAWLAIVDANNPEHLRAKRYFEYLLERDAKLVTNNIVIDETLDALKQIQGVELSAKFNQIMEEALLTIKLRMDWISRRVRRNAINNFLRSTNPSLHMRHFFIKETLKRKKVDIIFSFDEALSEFNLPLMPQVELK